MFGLFRNLKRRRTARQPLPLAWKKILEKRLRFYRALSGRSRQVFERKLKIFLAEKRFIGGKGFEVTEEMKVVIGGLAVRLILFLPDDYYNRLHEIVVYPYDYVRPSVEPGAMAVVAPASEGDEMCGEVDDWNVVVLSWPSVVEGIENPGDGFNPALHEFAHVLDRATGAFNGTPQLRKRAHYKTWAEVMSRHFLRLKKGRGAARDVLDDYGAENEAEFFAVATEAFFERAQELKQTVPDLFQELKQFYGYDPAA